jgi:large subunit ribosomal protein L15
MNLENLPRRKDSVNKKKRVGRGYGSGKGGHTVGKGTKGQKSRGSGKIPLGFEGGQSPLYKKMPKIPHFKKRKEKAKTVVSLVKFNLFKDGEKVNPQSLLEKNIVNRLSRYGVKIIANGNLHKKLEFAGFEISRGAEEKIKQSGSKISEE